MCYTIVIHFKHYWKELGQGLQTDVVFMDIAKAFDTVDHRRTGRGGRGGSFPPPKKITKSKSRANVQHESGEEWEIKKPKK